MSKISLARRPSQNSKSLEQQIETLFQNIMEKNKPFKLFTKLETGHKKEQQIANFILNNRRRLFSIDQPMVAKSFVVKNEILHNPPELIRKRTSASTHKTLLPIIMKKQEFTFQLSPW